MNGHMKVKFPIIIFTMRVICYDQFTILRFIILIVFVKGGNYETPYCATTCSHQFLLPLWV